MNNEDTTQELETENAELKATVAELEEESVKLTQRNKELETENAEYRTKLESFKEVKPKQRRIKDYKVGDFVVVQAPFQVEPENGRVLALLPGGSALLVATERGEVSIGDPSRIRKQSDA